MFNCSDPELVRGECLILFEERPSFDNFNRTIKFSSLGEFISLRLDWF